MITAFGLIQRPSPPALTGLGLLSGWWQFLKPLPALPSGKRYELDQRAAVLTIVDN